MQIIKILSRALRTESERTLALSDRWRVVDFTHTSFSAPLFKSKTCVRSVGDNVAANRFRRILRKAHAVRIGYNLLKSTMRVTG
jgi:hypothetical protein